MNKITKKIIEPSKVNVDSTFKIKIKTIRYATYAEIKSKLTYTTLKDYTYDNLKGD